MGLFPGFAVLEIQSTHRPVLAGGQLCLLSCMSLGLGCPAGGPLPPQLTPVRAPLMEGTGSAPPLHPTSLLQSYQLGEMAGP